MQTAFDHCRPGGAALFAPDFVRETFVENVDHGGNDTDQGSVRFLQWTTDPDPSDTSYFVDFAIMIRDLNGTLRVEHDRHAAKAPGGERQRARRFDPERRHAAGEREPTRRRKADPQAGEAPRSPKDGQAAKGRHL